MKIKLCTMLGLIGAFIAELFGDWDAGMASSNVDTDYYALVNKTIMTQNSEYTASRLSGVKFETATSDSDVETYFSTLDTYLSEDTDLIIVQLGDNVNTTDQQAYFSDSFKTLLSHIRSVCPKARVACINTWYNATSIDKIISNSCVDIGCVYISITDLKTTDNQSAVGNEYIDENGDTATITTAGVASHPNDNGMLAIANRICYKLGITSSETEITG